MKIKMRLSFQTCSALVAEFFYNSGSYCSLNYTAGKCRSLGYISGKTCILNTLLIHVII